MHAALAVLWLTVSAFEPAVPLSDVQRTQAREIIAKMQKNRRGPYQGVSWFCNDGTILPPKSYACVPHGGGVQYGVLSPDAEKLGAMGVHVGTVVTSLKPEAFIANDYYRCRAFIVEMYLERSLDGWALELAKSYRGFRQVEDDLEFSRRLLLELNKRHEILTRYRGLMVRLIRAMPYGAGGSLADEVRAMAGQIGDEDMEGFGDLRFKIHAMPEPADIEAVEAYAKAKGGELGQRAATLASKMKAYYDPSERVSRLETVRRLTHDGATKKAIDAFLALDFEDGAALVHVGAELIETADKAIRAGTTDQQGERNLLLLHIMELIEELWIGATADLRQRPMKRDEALALMRDLLRSAQALGWLSGRENEAAQAAVERMATGVPTEYAAGYDHLERVLEWGRARLLADLGLALNRYESVEPRARNVIDDQLRSSLMLPMAAVLDRLSADINKLRGGGHELLGLEGARDAAMRGENPGIAVGALRVLHAGDDLHQLERSEIALLHGLPPELPPVAGIITVGPVGSLSHVALLARNLGIPRASVGGEVAKALEVVAGQEVMLAVSAGRRVAFGPLAALSGADRRLVVEQRRTSVPTLEIAADKLDIVSTEILPLTEISEKDSGVRVGPKAAELGRLKRLFPDRVSDAAIIPFGAFVKHVNRPGPNGEPSPLETLRHAYVQATGMPASEQEAFLLRALDVFRGAIAVLPFADGFEKEVDAALAKLGRPGTFGVFVRSDTNVEDLKEFTGAGLNLTVPNCVAVTEILAAIRDVWASPFTERSFRWRQRLLVNPEHVYPSIILHRTVPSEISGVMVTIDLETGSGDALTVSCSEGVAAVVDGGAPETVVIQGSGEVKLLASSRATTCKRIPPLPRSGVVVVPAGRSGTLLGDKEIAELESLAREVNAKIPPREAGVPWDIEFGFYQGRAYLMQIRPLKISRTAATHPFLKRLDEGATLPTAKLDLSEEVP
ncbi:MAG: PEP/pyruvate-binding domain-containing protein [Myxococcota bacterium]